MTGLNSEVWKKVGSYMIALQQWRRLIYPNLLLSERSMEYKTVKRFMSPYY